MVLTCVPPFNDFIYSDNVTLLEQAIAQYDSNPAMGWAHVLGGTSPLTPCPKDESGLVNIQYCWPDQDIKRMLEAAIRGGWDMWHKLLGSGGAEQGHHLEGFSEYTDGQEPVLCWLDKDRLICESKRMA